MAAAISFFDAFGLFMGGLGIFSFTQHNFIERQYEGVGFNFAVGLDGASAPGKGPLENAGGNLPDIRVFNEHGDLIGTKINDKTKCKSGSTNCDSLVKNVNQQPTYTLFSGNTDAICMAYITVTFPEGDRYAWVGNFARHCGGAWYYSDIYVPNNKGADKVECAWVDGNGDVRTTGIQVHWPDYSAGSGHSGDYYCHNPAVLTFHGIHDPYQVILPKHKRDMFSPNPSFETKSFDVPPKDSKPSDPSLHKRLARDTRLVKSKATSHLASKLCNSSSSAGPSFVSYQERKFCHMADKKLYAFCEDTKKGDCWDDVKHEIVHKAAGGVIKRAANPAVAFTETLRWGEA